MQPKIYLSPPHISKKEYDYVEKALLSNWVAPAGPFIHQLENYLENILSKKYCTALNSGTSAIHLGLQLLGIGKGDVVICQSFTFVATANPITYLGAEPVFIGSEPDTWNMNPVLLEEAISEMIKKGKKPKAIIAVHAYGMPYKISEIHTIANTYEIPVLEDSAEALGSKFKNDFCGAFGAYSVFSFNGNKIITTSGGGALVCNNEALKEKALYLSTQAKDTEIDFSHGKTGYNYRMSNVAAAIGCAQIENLEGKVKARRNNFLYYKHALGNYDEISFQKEAENSYSNRWLTCVLVSSEEKRNYIINNLKNENIESRTLWKPMHLQVIFKENKAYCNGISEHLYKTGLCLPSGSNLTEADLERITKVIIKSL